MRKQSLAEGANQLEPGMKAVSAAGVVHPLLLETPEIRLPIIMQDGIALNLVAACLLFGSGWLGCLVLQNGLEFRMLARHHQQLAGNLIPVRLIDVPIVLQRLSFLSRKPWKPDFRGWCVNGWAIFRIHIFACNLDRSTFSASIWQLRDLGKKGRIS